MISVDKTIEKGRISLLNACASPQQLLFLIFIIIINLTCVTIPFRNNGRWSGDGCSLVKTNGSHVVCTCNHLTNFAILINIKPQKVMWLWIKGAVLLGYCC